jgi:cell division septum initiation protein DivIVA
VNPPVDDLDPARLESADFEQVRRGFDPAAVRGELHRAAQEIRRLQRDRDELAGRLAEFEGVSTGQLEARRVAAALGVEATQVLEAAHQAASERAERAEREADAVRDEAREVAEQVRADAFAEREQILDEARREAETVMADGRERGRDMVAEAQTVRERMLRDLARKRQTGRAQVEQLRAGRDRLLESLSIAQDSLDTAVADLVNSVPEARSAAERAGLRVTSESVPTADELEGEIEAARVVGHPLLDDVVDPGPVDDTFTTGEMEALPHLDVLDDGSVEAGAGELVAEAGEVEIGTEESDKPDENDAVSDTLPGSDEAHAEVAADEGSVGLYDVEQEQHDPEEEDTVGIGEVVADLEDEPEPDATEEAHLPEPPGDEFDAGDDDGAEPVAFEAVVDDVFARLRSSQGEVADEDGAVDPDEISDDADDEAVDEAVDRADVSDDTDTGDSGDAAPADELPVLGESDSVGAAEPESVADTLDPERAAARPRPPMWSPGHSRRRWSRSRAPCSMGSVAAGPRPSASSPAIRWRTLPPTRQPPRPASRRSPPPSGVRSDSD